VYTDETMPAMAAGAKSILYGDISKYWVRQVGTIRFERSEEFAFDRDLITFRGLARLDGALVDNTGSVKAFVNSAT
jgi:HK97 family phage major capsid protein